MGAAYSEYSRRTGVAMARLGEVYRRYQLFAGTLGYLFTLHNVSGTPEMCSSKLIRSRCQGGLWMGGESG